MANINPCNKVLMQHLRSYSKPCPSRVKQACQEVVVWSVFDTLQLLLLYQVFPHFFKAICKVTITALPLELEQIESQRGL